MAPNGQRALTISPCRCTGSGARHPVHGFLVRGDERVGLYLASLVGLFEDGGAVLDVALGLSDGATVALRLESDGFQARMRLVAPERLSLHSGRSHGRWLSRAEASQRLREVKRLVEVIVRRDVRLLAALDLPPPTIRRHHVA
jgi:hypothetical protein